jgi:hypothetical protein
MIIFPQLCRFHRWRTKLMKHNSVAPLSVRWLGMGLGGLLLAAVCTNGVGAGSPADENEQSKPELGPNASLRGYRPRDF